MTARDDKRGEVESDDEFERMTRVAKRTIEERRRFIAADKDELSPETSTEVYLASAFLKYARSHAPRKECCGLGYVAGVSECPGCPRASAASTTRQTEVLTYERDQAQAMYENAVRFLTRIYAFLNPPFVTANGKTYSFQNPDANATLQILSDAIRAIPEDLRSAASATPRSAVIEECAKVCDQVYDETQKIASAVVKPATRNKELRHQAIGATCCAARLRALMNSPDGGKQT